MNGKFVDAWAVSATADWIPAMFARAGNESIRLGDGRRVTVRPVAAADRDEIQAFVRNLDPETRRRRYFTPIRELSEPMLESVVHPDPERERVYVAIAEGDANPGLVAVAQYARAEHAEDCEIALVLADDVQGQGLGTRLMARLLDAAKAGGFRRAVGDVLRDNRAMISLARRAGFDVGINAADPDLVRIVRPFEQPRQAALRPRMIDLVSRGVDALRATAPPARGAASSGLEPV